MADKKGQQMISFLTCEIPFGQDVCELVFGVDVFDIWILESRLIRSNSQSRATLWVLETCLIVGLLPLMIILITASLSSTHTIKLLDARIGHLKEQHRCLSSHRFSYETCDVCEYHSQVARSI